MTRDPLARRSRLLGDGRGPAEAAEPFTYVVGHDGLPRPAPRRGEHVACAGGPDVLGAGEITLGHIAS
ncbi:hypothetical protein ACWGIV_08810 [Streptomyces sp. NPDC054844]